MANYADGSVAGRGSVFGPAASAQLELVYRTPDVVRQRHETLAALGLQPGERVLDVGCGPGLLMEDMAERVGPRGHITGVDIADTMLELSTRRCARFGNSVDVINADAGHLPFDEASFDAVVSVQVYEYVSDIVAALAELYRVLRPDGRAVIIDTDWDSIVWNTGTPALMERILAAWRERFTNPFLPRTLTRRLTDTGFEVTSRTALVLLNPDYKPDTYSLANAAILADFVIGRNGLTHDDVTAWSDDLRRLGEDGTYFFSLNRYLFSVHKPAA